MLSRASLAAGAADGGKAIAVALDVVMAGCGSALDPRCCRCRCWKRLALRLVDERNSEPELVADAEPAGLEAPVVEHGGCVIIARLLGNLRLFRRYDDRRRHRH